MTGTIIVPTRERWPGARKLVVAQLKSATANVSLRPKAGEMSLDNVTRGVDLAGLAKNARFSDVRENLGWEKTAAGTICWIAE